MANVPLKSLVFPGLDPTYTVPQKTSDLTNDSGFVNASGAASAAPVQSVNGQTGTVVLDASDVGALPDDTTVTDVYQKYPSPSTFTYWRPLLIGAASASQETGDFLEQTGQAYTFSGIRVQPSTGTIKATTFKGNLTGTASGNIAAPSSPATGAYLVYSGSAWVARVENEEVTISTAGAVTQALDPGKLYHFTGALSSLTLTFNAAATGQIAQYHFDFDSGSTAPTVTLPVTVTMQGGSFAPEANKHYEVDVLNGYGVYVAW